MTREDITVKACPDLSEAARTVLTDHSLKPTHRLILLGHLADPTLSPADLAKALNVSRSTVYLALAAVSEVSEVSENRTDRTSEVSENRTDEGGPSCARALPRSSEGDISPSPEVQEQARPLFEQPGEGGLTPSEREAFIDQVLEGRAALGLPTTRISDPVQRRAQVWRVLRDLLNDLGGGTSARDHLAEVAIDGVFFTDKALRYRLSQLHLIERERQPRRKPNAGGWQSHADSLIPADYGEG